MMRLRRALVTATLSLLLSATTAHAECAWVLWSTVVGSLSDEEVSPVSAVETKQQCELALAKQINHVKRVLCALREVVKAMGYNRRRRQIGGGLHE